MVQALVDLWEQVKEVIATPLVAGQSIATQRVSVDWSLALIKQSTNYLQKQCVSTPFISRLSISN